MELDVDTWLDPIYVIQDQNLNLCPTSSVNRATTE